MAWKYGRSKPVIGLLGGVGSGKSAVARLFAREGCAVIDSDAAAHEALQSPGVQDELRRWLGASIFDGPAHVSRKALAAVVFSDPEKLRRLNGIIHPRVGQRRDELMAAYLNNPQVKAIVWDTPLLVETVLHRECDRLVFVSVPLEIRLARINRTRGWGPEELQRRENLQFTLDKKAALADYVVDNSGDEIASLGQVQRVLSHLFQVKSR
jgi:dephospho-CoA kinase